MDLMMMMIIITIMMMMMVFLHPETVCIVFRASYSCFSLDHIPVLKF
jgi:hypothetical protein